MLQNSKNADSDLQTYWERSQTVSLGMMSVTPQLLPAHLKGHDDSRPFGPLRTLPRKGPRRETTLRHISTTTIQKKGAADFRSFGSLRPPPRKGPRRETTLRHISTTTIQQNGAAVFRSFGSLRTPPGRVPGERRP